jgi:hypothetical protein
VEEIGDPLRVVEEAAWDRCVVLGRLRDGLLAPAHLGEDVDEEVDALVADTRPPSDDSRKTEETVRLPRAERARSGQREDHLGGQADEPGAR